MRRAFCYVGILAGFMLLSVACAGVAPAPTQERAGTGQVGGAEVAGIKIPVGIPDHPFPVIRPPDEKEKDPSKYRTGGDFRYLSLDPPHLDISLASSCTVYNVNDMVYSKLVRAKLGPTANPFLIELEPDLAKSWDISADGKTYTFKLHEGAKFQNLPPVNGREVTAEDVLWNYQEYAKAGVQRSYFELVDKMEAVDKHTFRITLKQPFPDFLPGLAEMSYIRPKEIREADGNFRKQAIGSGPFILEEWSPKQGVKYRKNPDYFERDTAGNRMPYLDRAQMFVIPDAAVSRAAYRAGQVDVVGATLIQDAEETLKSNPDTIFESAGSGLTRGNINGVHVRLDKPPFNDLRVRRALSMALDRQGLNDTLYEGRGTMSMGMYWVFWTDQFPNLKDYGPWYQHNPTEAKKLLAEAGFPNGISINLVDWYLRTPADVLVAQWKESGINVKRREVDNPTHVVMLNEKKWDEMTGVIWGIPSYTVDASIYPWWHSKGSKNFDNLSDPELDRLLEAQRAELDPAKRKKLLEQIWQRNLDQVYQIWWPTSRGMYGYPKHIKNLRGHAIVGTTSCYTTGIARHVWIDK
ncbi:MAG: ABC transporter substrate-binding protein [Chloroflexi bacterium]|nr:ABC transporter substrate-binding protein [Chloroflexota bacterium]